MKELEKRREAEERAALSEAERHLEDARADLAATVEEMGRASVEGGAEIGSLKERADAVEGELSKLHATLEMALVSSVACNLLSSPSTASALSFRLPISAPPSTDALSISSTVAARSARASSKCRSASDSAALSSASRLFSNSFIAASAASRAPTSL